MRAVRVLQLCYARPAAPRCGQAQVRNLGGGANVSQDESERHGQDQPGARAAYADPYLRAASHQQLFLLRCRRSQTALQKLPINVPRSASSEAFATVASKEGDDVTPRDALSAFASGLPAPPPRSGMRHTPPPVEEQVLSSDQDDQIPMEADAVRSTMPLATRFQGSLTH